MGLDTAASDSELPHPCLKVAHAAVAALDLIGVPSAILQPAGKPIALNGRLERMIPAVIRDSGERLQLTNVAADELLRDALTKLVNEERGEPARSIPIPAAGMWPPVIIHVFAFDIASEDFQEALSLVTITIVTRRDAPTIPTIEGLFDMTPAEARIAQAVAQCQTLDAIATRLGLSRQTLRSQIRAALAKAGCARNIDLAALLSGMGSTVS